MFWVLQIHLGSVDPAVFVVFLFVPFSFRQDVKSQFGSVLESMWGAPARGSWPWFEPSM